MSTHQHLRLDLPLARRLVLFSAGLLPDAGHGTGIPHRLTKNDDPRVWARKIIDHFGFLQLDTIPISGGRSHALVLASRLDGFQMTLGEQLLRPAEPHFEYWGHEACWMPLSLYPVFDFRRRQFRTHPWWGNIIDEHPAEVDKVLRRIETEGAVRSADLDGTRGKAFWDLKLAKKVCDALWSSGELAISERSRFLRSFDLRDRVIPQNHQGAMPEDEAICHLLWLALRGHGWATTSTLVATWRLRNRGPQLKRCISALADQGKIIQAFLTVDSTREIPGWVLPESLPVLETLTQWTANPKHAVLLSPFDPILWDRDRVALLFGFDQVLEIYKPAPIRKYGYYCLPVLSGERLLARVDLKAQMAQRKIDIVSVRYESTQTNAALHKAEERAVETALKRHHNAVFGPDENTDEPTPKRPRKHTPIPVPTI